MAKRNRFFYIMYIMIFTLSCAFYFAQDGVCANQIKYYSTTSGLMYFRVTNVIYNDSLLMDSGERKRPTKNNTFAQIMINFANLTDKPVANYGLNPVEISVAPSRLYLVGQSGKYYAGANATNFLRKEVKPFTQKITLKPGDDIVRAMAFHVPKNDEIVGVVYKFDGGMTLSINYNDPSQMQK